MLQEMAAMGFEWVELSHGIRITLVPGIMKALEEGVIKVASCHNFCPLPTGIMHAAPNHYEPSCKDDREREQWLRQSKRSLEFAKQVGAKRLVAHLGSVEFFWFNPGRKLDRYMEAHPGVDYPQDAAYQKLRNSALAKLNARKSIYWENTRAGVAELLPYAAEKGVVLGFENREAFEELPLDADFEEFMNSLPPGAAGGYWHDTGHAHIKEGMGFLHHREHLEKLASRLVGFHLHDVNEEGYDHQAVGSGKIDFEMISHFWRPEHTLVIELSPRLTPEEVISSRRRIEALIDARFHVATKS